MTSFFSAWGPVATWAGIIFFFSSQPDLGLPWGLWDFVLRKIAHMVEFGIFSLLVWRALGLHGWHRFPRFLASLLFSFAYAISDEFHQGFVPRRSPSMDDVAIDLIGILLVSWWCLKRRNSPEREEG